MIYLLVVTYGVSDVCPRVHFALGGGGGGGKKFALESTMLHDIFTVVSIY